MIKTILAYIFAAFLIFSGVMHIIRPEFYSPMIPDFIPELLANIFAAVAEIAIGVMLILPKYRKLGGLAFAALMIVFLPIHIWDMLKDNPAVGSFNAAVIRLIIQFGLIAAGWWIGQEKK